MSEAEQTTLNLIFSAAMQEFLEKGFNSVSLRNIKHLFFSSISAVMLNL